MRPELTRKEIKKLTLTCIKNNDFEGIIALSKRDTRVLSIIITYTYDKSTDLCWTAINLAGKLIAYIGTYDLKRAKERLDRLVMGMNKRSYVVSWSSPEIIGEAVRENPEHFEEYIPILIAFSRSDTGENIFLAGIIHALSRIIEKHNKYLSGGVLAIIDGALKSNFPEWVAASLIASRRLNLHVDENIINDIKNNSATASVYYKEHIRILPINELAMTLSLT